MKCQTLLSLKETIRILSAEDLNGALRGYIDPEKGLLEDDCCYYCTKTYLEVTQWNFLSETILVSDHKICLNAKNDNNIQNDHLGIAPDKTTFSTKQIDIFLISPQKCMFCVCVYSLEAPPQGTPNEYPHVFGKQ